MEDVVFWSHIDTLDDYARALRMGVVVGSTDLTIDPHVSLQVARLIEAQAVPPVAADPVIVVVERDLPLSPWMQVCLVWVFSLWAAVAVFTPAKAMAVFFAGFVAGWL